MSARHSYQCYVTGDHALTFSFGDTMDVDVNECCLQLFHEYQKLKPDGIKDCIPAYTTITFIYDAIYFLKRNIDPINTIQQLVDEVLIPGGVIHNKKTTTLIRIPVCYETICAPDLASLAALKQISTNELVQLHSSTTYRVFMNGFLPGFACSDIFSFSSVFLLSLMTSSFSVPSDCLTLLIFISITPQNVVR